MPDELSPQLRNQIAQLQQLQQQAQAVMSQRLQLESQVKEMERTLEALQKVEASTPVYKSVGTLLLRAKDVEGVKTELADQKETAEVRLASVKKQEDRLREKLEALQKELQAALSDRAA